MQFVRRERGALVDQIRVERRRTTRAKSAHDLVSAIKVLLGPVLQGRVAKTTDKPYQLNDESWQWYRGYTNDKKSPIDEREKLCPSCNCVRHAGGLLCFLGHKNSPERILARGLFFFSLRWKRFYWRRSGAATWGLRGRAIWTQKIAFLIFDLFLTNSIVFIFWYFASFFSRTSIKLNRFMNVQNIN